MTCKMLPGEGSPDIVEWLRSFVKAKYAESGYAGFSEEYDRQFDKFSFYFYVVDDSNDLHAVQRVIHKTPENLLPMEKAVICGSREEKFVIYDHDVVEITSFVFKRGRAIELLVAAVAEYGRINGIKKAYALVNRDSRTLRKIYLKLGWEASRAYSSAISFPDYGKMARSDLVPAVWEIMELPEDKIRLIASTIDKYRPASVKG